jgi:hypothetical protein
VAESLEPTKGTPLGKSGRRSKRKRGAESSSSFKASRNQRWAQARGDSGGSDLRRQARLLGRALAQGEVLLGGSYDILEDGSVSSTGWQGSPPPKMARDAITRRYHTGEILHDLKTFHPVPYR